MRLFDDLKRFVRDRVAANPPDRWPFIRGDYVVVDATAPVVVTTAADTHLTRELAALKPPGLCMSSPLKGSADDLVNLIDTVAANLSIQYLVCAGTEQEKQPLSSALLLLIRDEEPADDAAGALARATIAKAQMAHLTACRKRLKAVDMLGDVDAAKLARAVAELAAEATNPNTGFLAPRDDAAGVERLIVPRNVTLDSRAGQDRRLQHPPRRSLDHRRASESKGSFAAYHRRQDRERHLPHVDT